MKDLHRVRELIHGGWPHEIATRRRDGTSNECSILYTARGIVEWSKKNNGRDMIVFYGKIATLKDLTYISKLIENVEKKTIQLQI